MYKISNLTKILAVMSVLFLSAPLYAQEKYDIRPLRWIALPAEKPIGYDEAMRDHQMWDDPQRDESLPAKILKLIIPVYGYTPENSTDPYTGKPIKSWGTIGFNDAYLGAIRFYPEEEFRSKEPRLYSFTVPTIYELPDFIVRITTEATNSPRMLTNRTKITYGQPYLELQTLGQ